MRQTWGDVGDASDLVYVPQAPSAANNYASIKTIVNDRVGNVETFSYNAANQPVVARAYAGRWNPDLPTQEPDLASPPVPQLRPSDPRITETRFTYNGDSLITLTEHPNQNALCAGLPTPHMARPKVSMASPRYGGVGRPAPSLFPC